MTINIVLTAQLILTTIIASQGIFYLLGAARAYKHLSLHAFNEQRRLLDSVLPSRLKILYVLVLMTGLTGLFLLHDAILSRPFTGVLLSLSLILADIVLAIKINLPINHAIIHLETGDLDRGTKLQQTWLKAISARGILSALSLIAVLWSWASL